MTEIVKVENVRQVVEPQRCAAVVRSGDAKYGVLVIVSPPTDYILVDVTVIEDGESRVEEHRLYRWNHPSFIIYKDGEPTEDDLQAAAYLFKQVEKSTDGQGEAPHQDA